MKCHIFDPMLQVWPDDLIHSPSCCSRPVAYMRYYVDPLNMRVAPVAYPRQFSSVGNPPTSWWSFHQSLPSPRRTKWCGGSRSNLSQHYSWVNLSSAIRKAAFTLMKYPSSSSSPMWYLYTITALLVQTLLLPAQIKYAVSWFRSPLSKAHYIPTVEFAALCAVVLQWLQAAANEDNYYAYQK